MNINRSAESPLGFAYTSVPAAPARSPDIRRACFRVRKVLEGVVHDTVALEGNPFTLPEVKTLIEGITVGGRRVEDALQVLNQAASWRSLLERVESGRFTLSRDTACALHALVAHEEALEWGVFRSGSVAIAGTRHRPPAAERLGAIFERGREALETIPAVQERAVAAFLFCAFNQFFWDGNRRTGRLLMNGILLSAGHDAISVPAAAKQTFDAAMIRFYDSRDGAEMMRFMAGCSLDPDLQGGAAGAPA